MWEANFFTINVFIIHNVNYVNHVLKAVFKIKYLMHPHSSNQGHIYIFSFLTLMELVGQMSKYKFKNLGIF